MNLNENHSPMAEKDIVDITADKMMPGGSSLLPL